MEKRLQKEKERKKVETDEKDTTSQQQQKKEKKMVIPEQEKEKDKNNEGRVIYIRPKRPLNFVSFFLIYCVGWSFFVLKVKENTVLVLVQVGIELPCTPRSGFVLTHTTIANLIFL